MKRRPIIFVVLIVLIVAAPLLLFAQWSPWGHLSATSPILTKGKGTPSKDHLLSWQPRNNHKTELQLKLPPQAKIAFIIDDVGLVSPQHKWAADFFKIPAPLTWSVLPFRPYTHVCAVAGEKHGFQVTLHLPIDPFKGRKKPGVGFIIKGSSKEQVIQQFEADLAQVPEAMGLNNHMGNLSTKDKLITSVLMGQVKKHNLFVIDSLTGPHSIIGKYAQLSNIPFAARDLFIDDKKSMGYKLAVLHRLIKIARKYGKAIGIGHVRPGTAKAILKILPELKQDGIEIVPVSELTKISSHT